jgi:hypothetical protein
VKKKTKKSKYPLLFTEDTCYMQWTSQGNIRVFESDETYEVLRDAGYSSIEFYYTYGNSVYRCELSEDFNVAA